MLASSTTNLDCNVPADTLEPRFSLVGEKYFPTSSVLPAAARDAAAKLCGVTVLAVKPAAVQAFLVELQEGFSDQDIKKHKFEVQDGHLAATGYVIAQTMTGTLTETSG